MAPLTFTTNVDAPTCRQRLLGAGRPGYLAIASDGSAQLGAWAPSSNGAPPSGGVFCRILLNTVGDTTRVELRTGVGSIVRLGFYSWLGVATTAAFVSGVPPAFQEGHLWGKTLSLLAGVLLSAAVMIAARVFDGWTLKRRVMETIHRELNPPAAAEPRVAADRAAPGR
jgi:hypothetical protein